VDAQSYIQSGILELYVMDALTPEQMAEVERRAAEDPVVAHEIREIREALVELDRHHRRAPRAELRDELLDAVADTASSPASERAAARMIPLASAELAARPGRYLLAASWILVALSIGAAAYFGIRWRSAEAAVGRLRDENRALVERNGVIASEVERASHLLGSAEVHVVTMKGTEHAPAAHAIVYWDQRSHEVLLGANDLPRPPAGKQYQLWAIREGRRRDAGVFDVGDTIDPLQRLKSVESADAFAVTLERAGGSPTPDLTQIYAVGSM
jgi:anti-sigma-K factor RskA